MKAYLSRDEAIEYSGRSYSTLKSWSRSGKVQTRKDKGKVLYKASDMASVLRDQAGKMSSAKKKMPQGEQSSDGSSEVDNINPPSWLSPEASDLFREIINQTKNYGNIQPADVHGLAMCAKYLAEFQLCEAKLREAQKKDPAKGGFIITDKNKVTRIDPLARHQRQCAELFFQYSARYGLTPSDRESLKIVVKTDEKSGEPVR